jgi:hypothetical protein
MASNGDSSAPPIVGQVAERFGLVRLLLDQRKQRVKALVKLGGRNRRRKLRGALG